MAKYGKTTIKGKTYYRTRVTYPDGSRKTLYAKTQNELTKLLVAERAKINSRKQDGGCPTVAEYAAMRLEIMREHVQPQTYAGYESKVRKCISVPPLGDKLMRDVTSDDIDQAMLRVAPLSASYYHTVHMLICSIFRAAKKSHLILEDPTEGLSSRGGQPKKDLPALTDEQVDTLLATVSGLRVETFVMIGVYAGLRREEILALQWDCVHLEVSHPYLEVRRTWHISHNQPVITDLTKTEAGRRNVPIPSMLVNRLYAEKAKNESDYVVANSAGGPLSETQWRHLWRLVTKRTTQERTYIRYKKGRDKTVHTVTPKLGTRADHNPTVVYSMDFVPTPHQLRRTYVTNLIYSGADPKTVQYLAGHKSAKITMDIYAKIKYNRPEDLAATVTKAFSVREGR